MSDFLLDSNHDLAFVNGDLVIATGLDAIRQHLMIRLRFFLGEWFRNRKEGIDYYGRILVKNPNTSLIAALLSRVVRETPGVSSVDVFDLTYVPADRRLTVSFTAVCDTGATLTFSDFVLVENGTVLPSAG